MQNVIAEARGQTAAPAVTSTAPVPVRQEDPYQQTQASMMSATSYMQMYGGQQQQMQQTAAVGQVSAASRNPYDSMQGVGGYQPQQPVTSSSSADTGTQQQQQQQQQWPGQQQQQTSFSASQYDPYGYGQNSLTQQKPVDSHKPPEQSSVDTDPMPRSMSLFDRRRPPQKPAATDDNYGSNEQQVKGSGDTRNEAPRDPFDRPPSSASSLDSQTMDSKGGLMSRQFGRGQGDSRTMYQSSYDQRDPDDRSAQRTAAPNPFGILNLNTDIGGQFSNPNFWEKIAAGVSSIPDVKQPQQPYTPASTSSQGLPSSTMNDPR